MLRKNYHRIVLVAALQLFAAAAFAAAPAPLPTPDLAYGSAGGGTHRPQVIGIGPTGRAYVAGTFTEVNGQPRSGIARLNPDGSLDAWAPTLPAAGIARLAVEDANGNVALSFGLAGTADNRLVYVPASTQAGALVDTEPASTGRQFNRLAFDAAGALYAAVSRRCSNGLPAESAVVKKYAGGTTSASAFAVAPQRPGATSCVNALVAHNGHLYVGGMSSPALFRVDTTSGAMDSAWRPAVEQFVADILPAPGAIYVSGWLGTLGTRCRCVARYSLSDGAMDAAWLPPVFVSGTWAPMALDPAAGHLYVTSDVSLAENVHGLAAISTTTGAIVPTWNPGPGPRPDPDSPGVGSLLVLADRLLVGGGFAVPRAGYAAFPLASAPVTHAVVKASPAELDFGMTFQAGTTRSRTFTLTNVGGGDLVVSSVGFPNRPDFSQANTCSAPVPPGGACTVTVTVQMKRHEYPGGWFPTPTMVAHNGAGPFSVITWGGNGTPTLEASGRYYVRGNPGRISFPPTPIGARRTTEVTIANIADRPVAFEEIRMVRAFAPAGVFTQTNDCPALLPVAGRCTARVTFAPVREGTNLFDVLVPATDSTGAMMFVEGDGTAPSADDDGDGIPNGVELAIGRDPMVRDNDVFADPLLFAMQQYRDFLGRAPEDSGAAFWAARIASGSITRAGLAAEFLGSPEFEAKVAPIARLYLAYFLRIPDYGGLDYWIGRHRAGESIESISNAFAGSPEFAARYGSLGDKQFVERVYVNVLGRAPDSGGHAFWTSKLAAMSRGELMVSFSESAEYRELTAHEVFVTMAYAGMLRRAPDPQGFAAWVEFLDRGNPREAMLRGILDSPEYRSRFLP